MTVAELYESMTGDEYMRWGVYFGRKSQREQLAAKRSQHRGR